MSVSTSMVQSPGIFIQAPFAPLMIYPTVFGKKTVHRTVEVRGRSTDHRGWLPIIESRGITERAMAELDLSRFADISQTEVHRFTDDALEKFAYRLVGAAKLIDVVSTKDLSSAQIVQLTRASHNDPADIDDTRWFWIFETLSETYKPIPLAPLSFEALCAGCQDAKQAQHFVHEGRLTEAASLVKTLSRSLVPAADEAMAEPNLTKRLRTLRGLVTKATANHKLSSHTGMQTLRLPAAVAKKIDLA